MGDFKKITLSVLMFYFSRKYKHSYAEVLIIIVFDEEINMNE